MMESVGDYALLFKELEAKEFVNKVEYSKYLFARANVIVKESHDDYAKSFVSECDELLSPGMRLSNEDGSHLQSLLENYSDDEHLQPPHREHYLSMPILMGASVVEYVMSGDDEVFYHICEQYETMLQVINYYLDGPDVYSVDGKEVSSRFLHGLEQNTYFEQFSRAINQEPQ